ncbi:hypothetical protein C8R47DRAFT_1259968, partial [Mycena vitilis]
MRPTPKPPSWSPGGVPLRYLILAISFLVLHQHPLPGPLLLVVSEDGEAGNFCDATFSVGYTRASWNVSSPMNLPALVASVAE